jgi:hypothetical protein
LSDIDTPHETLLAEAVDVFQEALLRALKPPRGPILIPRDTHGVIRTNINYPDRPTSAHKCGALLSSPGTTPP